MRVRPYQPDDLPVLMQIHTRAGYEFDFPENIAEYQVVVDETDTPIMAAGYKLVPEITLVCAPGGYTHPVLKLKGIAMLHEALRDELTGNGYTEAIASVPPELQRNYGRHLQRHFKWRESWPTYRIKDWKGGV